MENPTSETQRIELPQWRRMNGLTYIEPYTPIRFGCIHIRFNNPKTNRLNPPTISSEFESQWYVIPPELLFPPDRDREPGLLRELHRSDFPAMPVALEFSTSVYSHPRIYVIGGRHVVTSPPRADGAAGMTNSVYCFDLKNTKKGWHKIKSMQTPRDTPCAVALDGKVYVFGGLSCDCCFKRGKSWNPMTGELFRDSDSPPRPKCATTKPYLEIYDPKTDTWEEQLHGFASILTPDVARLHAIFSDTMGRGNRHVLLRTADRLQSYDLHLKEFTLHHPGIVLSRRGPSAVVDGVLLCYSSGTIVGYDLKSDVWCGGGHVVEGLSWGREVPDYDSCLAVSLLSIGRGMLCVLWSSPEGGGGDRCVLRCSTLRVVRRPRRPLYEESLCGDSLLYAVVHSFKMFSFHALPEWQMDCFAM